MINAWEQLIVPHWWGTRVHLDCILGHTSNLDVLWHLINEPQLITASSANHCLSTNRTLFIILKSLLRQYHVPVWHCCSSSLWIIVGDFLFFIFLQYIIRLECCTVDGGMTLISLPLCNIYFKKVLLEIILLAAQGQGVFFPDRVHRPVECIHESTVKKAYFKKMLCYFLVLHNHHKFRYSWRIITCSLKNTQEVATVLPSNHTIIL